MNCKVAQPAWLNERWGYSGKAEKNLRDLSHVSLLVFALTAVATSVLACISLWSEFGIGASSSFIVVAVIFPLLCGWLAKERWRAEKLEARIKKLKANLGATGSPTHYVDNTPAGILIVTPDLRICFANQTCLRGTTQELREVLGWKIQDVISAEGIEHHAKTLVGRSAPASSCCFDTVRNEEIAGERPAHITMTRIAPWHGEDRILVVVEDVLPGSPLRPNPPAEGYLC